MAQTCGNCQSEVGPFKPSGLCSWCSNSRVKAGVTDLGTTHPELASQLVEPITALQVSAGSKRLLKWRCDTTPSHDWDAIVKSRAKNGNGCPHCSGYRVTPGETDLWTTHPELSATLIDPTVGRKFSAGSHEMTSWICEKGHVSQASIINKALKKSRCGVCSNQKIIVGENDLWTTHGEVAALLVDATVGFKVSAGSPLVTEWVCGVCDQVTSATVANKVRGTGCRVCLNQKIVPGVNDLSTMLPDLAAQLIDGSAGSHLSSFSGQSALWRCPKCSHEWTTTVASRSTGNKTGCRVCADSGFNVALPAWVYLVRCGGVIKYGITNDLATRLLVHRRQGFAELVEAIRFEKGADAQLLERAISEHKKAMAWPHARTKKQMPYGGYTETISLEDCGTGFSLKLFAAQTPG
jgi:hypothetical protein